MGVAGAALSNVVSQAIGVLMVLWLLFSGKTRLRLSKKDFMISLNIMVRIIKIGVPVLIMNLQRNFGNLLLTFLTAPFGTLAVAAHSLISRVEMFILLPGYALGMGAGVLVGQNLGAQKSQRAEKVAWITVTILEVLFVLFSLFILLKAEIIMAVFTSESGLIKLGSIFLRIATASYAIMAFIAVLQNCISSAGDTVSNMIISIMMIWAVQLPAAFLLSKYTSLEVYGIRWAIVLSTIFGTIVYIYYFRKGKWKGRKV
jgi:putative MATE family efflux protein